MSDSLFERIDNLLFFHDGGALLDVSFSGEFGDILGDGLDIIVDRSQLIVEDFNLLRDFSLLGLVSGIDHSGSQFVDLGDNNSFSLDESIFHRGELLQDDFVGV